MEQKLTSSTIIAPATPQTPAAISVIRMSGPDALEIAGQRWKGASLTSMSPNTLRIGQIMNTDGEVIDNVVLSYFKAPRSFTGEDCIEISSHGSPYITREIIGSLINAGAEPAGKGEFSKRAFINGKIDLIQAEAIADMIASDSEAARKIALGHLKGEMSGNIRNLTEKLLKLVSLLELEIDFSEEDVTFADRKELIGLTDEISSTLDRMAGSYSKGTAMKDGIQVTIIGMPNAGKSTLLNRLLKDDRAIVSDIPGTTRDIIEDTTLIGEIKFRFIDTAGIRHTSDKIEALGIEKAISRAKNARITIILIDATGDIEQQKKELLQSIGKTSDNKTITVINKCDMADRPLPEQDIQIIAKTGEGLEKLTDRLIEMASDGINLENDILITNARHYTLACKANESIRRASEAIKSGIPSDLIAQDLRHAIHHLSEITGEITSTTILNSIFSSFCIGK